MVETEAITGPEVTFPFVHSFLENATKMFGIFSSNLCLLGGSVHNSVEILEASSCTLGP